MKELTQIYKDAGQQLIEDLFKDYLVVSEKLSGSSFSFKKDSEGITFYKGGNQKPINLIDRTIMVYYEKPINFIKSVTSKNLSSIPENWKFCFQYFVNTNPGIITYDRLPKNNLVLTHIKVMTPSGKVTKVIEDPRVINDWANALGVTPLLPLFKGYLTEDQKKKIKEFLETPKEDHAEIFSTNSFAEYLLRILNPNIQSTTLQNDLKKPIESIVFKFYKSGTKQVIAAKLIDPYTINLMKEKEPIDIKKAPADINEIILLDLLAFIEERGIKKHEILGDGEDMRYIELVSNIFNDYVTKRGKDIAKIDIEKAEFAKGKEFDLNVELIPSQRTKDILNSNPKLKDLFKIMLGSLKKKRKNTGNIMTPSVIEDFNKMVNKVTDVIQTKDDGKFKTFDDYLKIKSTNESLLPNAEELLIEDKVLDYNNFINLGKVIVEDSRKNGEIWKTSTGFRGQDERGERKTFKSKEQTVAWIKTSSDVDKEPTEKTEDFDISKIDKKKSPGAFNLVEKIEKIKDPKQKAEAVKVVKALNDYETAETDADKKKAIESIINDIGANRNATGSDTNKIYLGQPIEKDKNDINTKTGLSYKSTFGNADTALTKDILGEAERLGIIFPLNNSAKRMSGASVAPNAIHRDQNGKKLKGVKIKTEVIEGKGKPGDDDYEAPGIALGGGSLVMRKTPPLTDKQKTKLREDFKNADPTRTEADVDRLMAINKEFRIQNNKKIEDIKSGDLTIIPIVNGDGKEVNLFTDEGKKEAVGIIAKNMTDRVDDLLSNPPGYKKSPQLQKGLDDFKKAGEKFSNGDITAEEFKETADALVVELKNDPQGKYGVPFLQETFIMAEGLANGKSIVSPSSANFAVADIIGFSSAELPADATPEQVNEYVQLINATSGGTSIKDGKGGASGSGAKLEATTYADYTDKNGKVIKGEEVKEDLLELAEGSERNDKGKRTGGGYDKIFNTIHKPKKVDGKITYPSLEKSMEDTIKLAEKYDVSDILEEKGLIKGSKKYNAQMKKYEKRANQKNRVEGLQEKYAKKKPPVELTDEEAKELLIQRFLARDINGFTMQEINNKQMMSQGFSNISRDVDPKKAGKQMSEEEAKKDPDIVKDAKGNPIVSLNTDGTPETGTNGEYKYRRKQKVVKEETNGITSLACMQYQDTPDFSGSGRPTNKNAAFVKKCKEGNRHIGDS